MIKSHFPLLCSNRALERTRSMLISGLSSTQMGSLASSPAVCLACSHVSCDSFPLRQRYGSISPADRSQRSPNRSACISRLYTTVWCPAAAAAFARWSAKAVFPTAGRAAMVIRSLFCHPPVILSSSVSPVGIPVTPSLFFCMRPSASVRVACISVSISRNCLLCPHAPSSLSSRLCPSTNVSVRSMVSSPESVSSLLNPTIISLRMYFW